MVVINAFAPNADPLREVREILDELILADHVLLDTVLDKKTKKMKLTGDRTEQHGIELVQRALGMLEEQKPLRQLTCTAEDDKSLRGFQLLTRKPLLLAVNIAEEMTTDAQSIRTSLSTYVETGGCDVIVLCGRIEMELAALDKDDQKSFFQDLGIAAPAMELVIQKSYELLGLISFLTVGEKEVRAWPIRRGTTAHRSAGIIHSDIERGFIRAETTAYRDYIEYKTAAALKAAGKTRLEGKDYIVHDGDVILFRFNV
jgi:GTP-binding protein YchF